MSRLRVSRRMGMAIVLALGLMMLVGLLVVGAVAVSTHAQRSSRLVATDAALTAGADYALNSVIGDPVGLGLADLPFGRTRTFDLLVPESLDVKATIAATRLPSGVLWLVAETEEESTSEIEGVRRVNLVARFRSPGGLPPAAIVARGSVRARVLVTMSVDSAGDPDCSASSSTAVIVGPGATADVGAGTPSAILQLAADSTTYYLAPKQLALLDSGAGVVHVRGDTVITGGSFDGILLVDGRLTVTGPVTMSGLIVARGPLTASSAGLSVIGALMSFAPASSVAVDLASATIRYAPCVVAHAIRVALPPKPVPRRSWAELF